MSRHTVLFDFDGTLVRGDCAARQLRALLAQGPLRRAVALASVPLAMPLFGHWRSMQPAVSWFSWLATVGREEAWLVEARARFIEACAARREQLLILPALERLRTHLAAGDTVVVVTGAERGLAQSLWSALDGPPLHFIGSRLRPRLGGWVAQEHCVGPRKLAALAREGLTAPFDAVYSDSAMDLPLLLAARRPILVEPRPRALSRVRRHLPDIEVIT